MKENTIHRASVMTLLAIAILSAALLPVSSQVKPPPASPDMKLQGLDGRVYDLKSLGGNVVLVSFGATWCQPCTTELRALEELLGEYRAKQVKFYWVSIESPDEINNGKLKQFAKERKISFPVMRDTAKMVFSQFSTRVRLPMIVLLNKDGRVDAPVQFGMRSPTAAYKADLRARLNKLLTAPAGSDR